MDRSSWLLSKNLKIKNSYIKINLTIMLYVWETRSPSLREHLKTNSLNEYLGPRTKRMGSGEGSTMRNFIVYTKVINCRRLRCANHVARMEEGTRVFQTLTFKHTGKRPTRIGKPRCRWDNNIRMYVKEIGINTRNWLTRLRIGIIEEHLCIRHSTSAFHKAMGASNPIRKVGKIEKFDISSSSYREIRK